MHPSEIRIGQNRYTAKELFHFMVDRQIYLDLSSESKWSNVDKSISIESIFLGLTMTPFYFDASHQKSWFVLDGNKRLIALWRFMSNDLVLEGMEFYPQYNGKCFKDLPYKMQWKLEKTTFTAHSINKGVSDEVKESIIKRIVPDTKDKPNYYLQKTLLNFWSCSRFKQMEESVSSVLPESKTDFSSNADAVFSYIRLCKLRQKDNESSDDTDNIALWFNKLNEGSQENLFKVFKESLEKINSEKELKYINKTSLPVFIVLMQEKGNEDDLISKWNQLYKERLKNSFWRNTPEKNYTDLIQLYEENTQ